MFTSALTDFVGDATAVAGVAVVVSVVAVTAVAGADVVAVVAAVAVVVAAARHAAPAETAGDAVAVDDWWFVAAVVVAVAVGWDAAANPRTEAVVVAERQPQCTGLVPKKTKKMIFKRIKMNFPFTC